MTCRIPERDLCCIEAKMEGLQDFETILSLIQGLLKEGKYKGLPKDAFYYALRGLKEGRIPAKFVGRISDIETLRKQGISFEVFDPIKKFPTHATLREFFFKATGKHLDGEDLEAYIDSAKQMPEEDRFIMIFKPRHSKLPLELVALKQIRGVDVTISQVVESKQRMNIFGRIKMPVECRYMRLFASLEMFNLVLKHRFKDERVVPNPVLGKSTEGQIERNGLTSTRDVCHFYLVPTGANESRLVTYDEADGLPCEENDFNQHDRYHVFVTSSAGSEGRDVSVRMAEQLRLFATSQKNAVSPMDYAAMKALYSLFIDIEIPKRYIIDWYARNKKQDSNQNKLFEQIKDTTTVSIAGHFFEPLLVCNQLYEAACTIRNPKSDESDRFNAKKILDSSTLLKPFDRRETLNKTFRLIASKLPRTSTYRKDAQHTVENQKRGTTEMIRDLNILGRSHPFGCFLVQDEIRKMRRFLRTLDKVFA